MKKLAVLFAALIAAAPAFAGNTGYVKLSLWGDIAVALPNNIHNITGLDLGIGSKADTVDGVQYDFIYNDAYKVRGIKTAWIYNSADIVYGIQSGIITYNRQDMRGVQSGLLNFSKGSAQGVQFAWGNVALEGEVIGLQAGLVNYAKNVTGLQLGFVNYAHNIKGLQLGLVNIAKNGWLPVMIIVNGRF